MIYDGSEDSYRTSLLTFDRALLFSDFEAGPLGDDIDLDDSDLAGKLPRFIGLF